MPESNAGWNFDNSYARLPELFYVKQAPVPVRAPEMVVFNAALAETLGLNPELLQGERGARIFSGNEVPPGAEPLAQAYAGHQFGYQNMLGDGRAILLGEQITPAGARFDLQLKGSGQTPFSRRGDGRAALGPMLREFIISEAMFALGIPTTRSLAVVATGEPVFREAPLPGAVLTRIAASHIRVGTFEFAGGVPESEPSLRALANYTIARHYPDLKADPQKYLRLIEGVAERQASLIAQWMQVGFIHGVMNTDNMTLSGETIDYGPCAFMDAYSPATVFSSIDRNGRYAFGNQPRIAAWNLARLAEAMLPLLHTEPAAALELAKGVVETFSHRFQRHWLAGMRGKLGIFNEEAGDAELIGKFLGWMEKEKADYTNTFRALSGEKEISLFAGAEFQAWKREWVARLGRQDLAMSEVRARMGSLNPAVIPRNHRVEEALAAAEQGDLSVMERLLTVLRNPFEELPAGSIYRDPATENTGYQTFCGT